MFSSWVLKLIILNTFNFQVICVVKILTPNTLKIAHVSLYKMIYVIINIYDIIILDHF